MASGVVGWDRTLHVVLKGAGVITHMSQALQSFFSVRPRCIDMHDVIAFQRISLESDTTEYDICHLWAELFCLRRARGNFQQGTWLLVNLFMGILWPLYMVLYLVGMYVISWILLNLLSVGHRPKNVSKWSFQDQFLILYTMLCAIK